MPRTYSARPAPPKTPTIWWSEDVAGWAVDTPYSADFVEKLKAATNRTARWHRDRKVWYVTEPYLETVKPLLRQFFGDFIFMPRQAPIAASGGGEEAEFLGMFTRDELNSAVRKAQLRLHPDKGGDPATSARFNALWGQLQRSLK